VRGRQDQQEQAVKLQESPPRARSEGGDALSPDPGAGYSRRLISRALAREPVGCQTLNPPSRLLKQSHLMDVHAVSRRAQPPHYLIVCFLCSGDEKTEERLIMELKVL